MTTRAAKSWKTGSVFALLAVLAMALPQGAQAKEIVALEYVIR